MSIKNPVFARMASLFLKQGADTSAYVLVVLFSVVGIVVSLHRFWQYDVYYYDFGIFDQAIWRVSRFQEPIIEHLVVGGKWIFADHFNPSLFLLAPLYWVTDKSEVLLVAQAIAVGLSGLFLYFIGKKVLHNGWYSVGILGIYFLFTGLQNAVISDFHEVTIATLPLMIAIYSIISKRVKTFFISFVVFLGFKESLMLAGIGLAVFIFFFDKEWRKIALFACGVAVVWGILAMKVVIPAFSGGSYHYSASLPHSIDQYIIQLVDVPVKQRTLFYTFFHFGFLPLLSPQFYVLIFQDFATRFYPYWPTRWDLGLHYSAIISGILAVSSLFSVRFLMSIKKFRRFIPIILVVLVLNSTYLFLRVLHGPFMLVTNPAFYEHTKNFTFLNEPVMKIPENTVVMTHNNLASRFTHQTVWLLKSNYNQKNPEYVLIDARDGQGPNNFFGTDLEPKAIVSKLLQDKKYEIFYNVNDQYIFKRK